MAEAAFAEASSGASLDNPFMTATSIQPTWGHNLAGVYECGAVACVPYAALPSYRACAGDVDAGG